MSGCDVGTRVFTRVAFVCVAVTARAWLQGEREREADRAAAQGPFVFGTGQIRGFLFGYSMSCEVQNKSYSSLVSGLPAGGEVCLRVSVDC